MSLKDTILAGNDRQLQPLEIPEWAVTVYIAPFSIAQADSLAEAARKGTVLDVYLLALREADGQPVFTAADLPKVRAEKSGKALERILDAFQKLNRIDAAAVEQAEKK